MLAQAMLPDSDIPRFRKVDTSGQGEEGPSTIISSVYLKKKLE